MNGCMAPPIRLSPRNPLLARCHVRRPDHLEEVASDVANPTAHGAAEAAAVAASVLDTYGESPLRAGSRWTDEQRGVPTAQLRLQDERSIGSALQHQAGNGSVHTSAVGVPEPGSAGASQGGPGGGWQHERLPGWRGAVGDELHHGAGRSRVTDDCVDAIG